MSYILIKNNGDIIKFSLNNLIGNNSCELMLNDSSVNYVERDMYGLILYDKNKEIKRTILTDGNMCSIDGVTYVKLKRPEYKSCKFPCLSLINKFTFKNMLYTDSGDLYVIGSNVSKNLGFPHITHIYKPMLLMNDKSIVKIFRNHVSTYIYKENGIYLFYLECIQINWVLVILRILMV